jgi:hypothetical protein
MNRKTNSSEHATQAIFSVCADEDVVQAATTASMNIPGALFAGEFRDYITAEKRPQFSSLLKNADSCVALFVERLKAAGIPLGLNLLDHSVEV